MLCYHDRTYCPHYLTCADGETCPDALTPEVQQRAQTWWQSCHGYGAPPICQYVDPPGCYKHEKQERDS